MQPNWLGRHFIVQNTNTKNLRATHTRELMHSILYCTRTFILLSVSVVAVASPAVADDGDPVAMRRWGRGTFTIETHWGLTLGVEAAPDVDLELVPKLANADHSIHTSSTSFNHVLSRLPNEDKPKWLPTEEAKEGDKNAVGVQSVPLYEKGPTATVVKVDGVTIVFMPAKVVAKKPLDTSKFKDTTVLVLVVDDMEDLGKPQFHKTIKAVKPVKVVIAPIAVIPSYFSGKLSADLKASHKNATTLAVSSASNSAESIEHVWLFTKPWEMPADMEKMFAAMEKSSLESQKVFAKFSIEQLNFKPSNGTHTPRWNAEHMMGRQLLFFSQIYHEIDPTIPVIDLNPQQMPKDYEFAHSDWTGAEEARQMQRVSDFTRRYAYLLEGHTLDKRAPGSRWPTLRALLKQMEHHYSEHTANTVKKFSLPDFPEK